MPHQSEYRRGRSFRFFDALVTSGTTEHSVHFINIYVIFVLFHIRATYFQHESNRVGRVNTESLAKPVIMRGSDGM